MEQKITVDWLPINMKIEFLLFFFVVQFSYSQISDSEKADRYSIQENFMEEIDLRKSILEGIQDRNSEEYKIQSYRLAYAEALSATDMEEKLAKISKAEEIFQTLKDQDPKKKIEVGLYHIEILMVLNNPEDARKRMDSLYDFATSQKQTPALKTLMIEILEHSSSIDLELANYEDSIRSLKEAIVISVDLFGQNSMETADLYKDLGRVYSFTDNFQESLSNGEKALAIYEKIQPKDKYVLFNQYATLYERYKYYGDLEKISSLFDKINDYYEANKSNPDFINLHNKDYPNLNAVKSVFLYIHLQQAAVDEDADKVERSFEDFIKSMPSEKVHYNNLELNTIVSFHFETGYSFHKSEGYTDLENYRKAKKYYEKALQFCRSIDFEFGELQAYWILSTLGVDYKQWEDVIPITELAFKKPSIEKFNQLGMLKHNLGLAYGGLRQYDKATALLEEEYRGYLNGNATDYYALDNLAESGNLYLEMYKESKQGDLLEKAYNNFHLCSVIFSRLYRGGEFSPRLSWYRNLINTGLLKSSTLLGKNEIAVVERIEINNSDYLWSSFIRNSKVDLNNSSFLLQMELDSLQEVQRKYAAQINHEPLATKEIEKLRTELKTSEKIYDTKLKELQVLDNSYYQFSRSDFDLNELRKNLGKGEVIVKYVLTDSSIFAFAIDKVSVKLYELNETGLVIQDKVANYLETIKLAKKEFIPQSQELYLTLIAPLSLPEKSSLIIFPDGNLSNLPFETLFSNDKKYLVEEHPISYSYSLMLFNIQKNMDEKSRGIVGAFSPQYDLQYAATSEKKDLQVLVRSGNYELKGAQDEARNINAIFGGDLFLGELATKSNFMTKSKDYDILHLAMHAVVDEEDSNKSSLIFNNDERLYLSELYEMKIPAHLAVLSACETGSGRLKEGEGVQSLSRAFTYAGVKSTVMSLWPVPDRETSVIMQDFYRYLKEGKSKDEALRSAKINYLTNVSEVELKHPYYWAGFIVSGDVAPLQNGISYWWYLGFALLALLLLLFWYLKRKRYL